MIFLISLFIIVGIIVIYITIRFELSYNLWLFILDERPDLIDTIPPVHELIKNWKLPLNKNYWINKVKETEDV